MRIHSVKQQQGSALVWLVSLTMIVGMLALVVDASMLYFEKRKLQSIANEVVSAIGDMNKACGYEGGDLKNEAQGYLRSKYADSQITVDRASWVYVGSDEGKHTVQPLSTSHMDRSNGITLEVSKPLSGFLYFIKGDSKLKAASTLKKEVVVAASLMSNALRVSTGEEAIILNAIFSTILGVNLDIKSDLKSISESVTDISKLIDNLGLKSTLNTIPLAELIEGIIEVTETPLNSTGNVVQGLLDQISTLGVNTDVDISKVISGITSVERIPDKANINTLNLVQSIIFSLADNLDMPIEINASDLLGTGNLGVLPISDDLLKLKIDLDPKPAIVIAPLIKDSNGNYPTLESSNVEVDIILNIANKLNLIELASANINVELGGALANLTGVSNCAVGNNNVVNSISLSGYSSLASVTPSVEVLKIADIPSAIEVCFDDVSYEPVAFGGSVNLSLDRDLSDSSNYPSHSLTNNNPLSEDVLRLSQSLGLSVLAGCRAGEITIISRELDSVIKGVADFVNGLGDVLSCILTLGLGPNCSEIEKQDKAKGALESILDPLKDVFEVTENLLLSPLLKILGVQLASGELEILGLTQQSVLIEGLFVSVE